MGREALTSPSVGRAHRGEGAISLERAIATVEGELTALGLGTKDQPKEGTEGWYLLRAKSLGLSFLRQIRQVESNPAALERHFKKATLEVKSE